MSSASLRNVALSLVLGALFLYLAFANVDIAQLRDAMQRFDPVYLIPALALSITLQLLRAWRWQLELRPLEQIGFGKLWVVISVAYMAINVLPARLGEFVRPWLLSKRSQVPFSSVVGNLVLEKTIDMVVILFFILLGLTTTENLPAWVRHGAKVPATVAFALALMVGLIFWKGEPFVERVVIGRLPERFADSVRRILKSFIDGMRILPDRRLLGAVFAISVAHWCMPILSSWVMIKAFSIDAPINAALVVFIFIGFGTALPNAPGMIGIYQYACILALGLFGVEEPVALAYGLVLNAIQLLTLVAQGLIAMPFAGVGLADFYRAGREIEPSGGSH